MQLAKATSPLIRLILNMLWRELLQVVEHPLTHPAYFYYEHVFCLVLILAGTCVFGRQREEEQDLVQRGAEGGGIPRVGPRSRWLAAGAHRSSHEGELTN